jgi:hypothetical protein
MMAMGLLPYEPTLDEYLWGGAPAPSTNTMHDWILGWTAAYNAQLTQTLIALQGVLAEPPAPLARGTMLCGERWNAFWEAIASGASGGDLLAILRGMQYAARYEQALLFEGMSHGIERILIDIESLLQGYGPNGMGQILKEGQAAWESLRTGMTENGETTQITGNLSQAIRSSSYAIMRISQYSGESYADLFGEYYNGMVASWMNFYEDWYQRTFGSEM